VLGSVVAVTDEVGLIKEANVYGPFGESEFSYKGKFYKDYGFDNRYGYTGQEQDTPGGLMYYGARWYDCEVGRFISEDPASADPRDPLTVNRYIYCRNNPLIYTDPTGMIFGLGDIACAAISNSLWKSHPKEMAILTGIVAAVVTGGLAAGAIGGAWGAAIGVGVGSVVGNYVTAFSMSAASGADISQSTNAGSRGVTQSNYVLTVISMGIAYFCYTPTQVDAPKPKDNATIDQIDPAKQKGTGLYIDSKTGKMT
jgi:RHS repeat-associated protein